MYDASGCHGRFGSSGHTSVSCTDDNGNQLTAKPQSNSTLSGYDDVNRGTLMIRWCEFDAVRPASSGRRIDFHKAGASNGSVGTRHTYLVHQQSVRTLTKREGPAPHGKLRPTEPVFTQQPCLFRNDSTTQRSSNVEMARHEAAAQG
jgi:hypothetical protein